jgi:multiple antibiotic resistance protein
MNRIAIAASVEEIHAGACVFSNIVRPGRFSRVEKLMLRDLTELGQLVSLGLAVLLPLANPLTSMTLLLSLGDRIPYTERQRQIRQAAFYVVGIMLVTYYAGSWIMETFGISIPGLRIAGGLIVIGIGFNMLFPSSGIEQIPEADKVEDAIRQKEVPNIAFVPLALPGTAGPGTIALIISAAASTDIVVPPDLSPWVLDAAPIIVFALLGLLFWVCLHFAAPLMRVIGRAGVEGVSRVMGFLLVCMGVQFLINGVLEIVDQYGVPGVR